MVATTRSTVLAEGFKFVENGAGTYTGTVVIPEDCVLVDIIVEAEALWTAATSATLDVGDATDPNGIYASVNLKATDLTAGQSLSLAQPGGLYGADYTPNDATAASAILGLAGHALRRKLTAARTLQAVVTSVGAGTAGRTTVTFVYARPDFAVITQ